MEQAFSFFRLFDLAFFVPGTLLMGFIWHANLVEQKHMTMRISEAGGIVALGVAISSVYLMGLICHGVQRLAYKRAGFRKLVKKCHFIWDDKNSSWYESLELEQKHDLASYFWYTRATCWNAAVALTIGALVSFSNLTWWWTSVIVIVIAVLLLLGVQFDLSLRRASGTLEPE